jgi:hypothetical protein
MQYAVFALLIFLYIFKILCSDHLIYFTIIRNIMLNIETAHGVLTWQAVSTVCYC